MSEMAIPHADIVIRASREPYCRRCEQSISWEAGWYGDFYEPPEHTMFKCQDCGMMVAQLIGDSHE